ncbi:MAG: serine/threonine-protein kinase [Solirubrobacterales bacterium]
MTPLLEAGSVLAGRYRLERVLGTGGMAAVWAAQDERLGRTVAVKLLSDVLLADPVYLTRFQREARLAAGLTHPNLVRIYDFGSEESRPFLAMEYVEGGSLADRVTAGTTPDLDSERFARELLQALDHIHRAGIVHRDVKPGNVLITPGGSAKLTDFGIAQPEDATRLTKTGFVVGTLKYLAPEVKRGEPATLRSDLYSCGIVLQEVTDESFSQRGAALVARLSSEDPEHRPQSAASALAILDGEVTAPTEPLDSSTTAPTKVLGEASHPTPAHRPREFVVPGSILVLLLLAALALGAILLAGNGDEPASGGGASDGGPGEEVRGEGSTTPVEESTVPEEEKTTSSEPPVPEEAADPPQKPTEAKEPKPQKDSPGKAKGLKKP